MQCSESVVSVRETALYRLVHALFRSARDWLLKFLCANRVRSERESMYQLI